MVSTYRERRAARAASLRAAAEARSRKALDTYSRAYEHADYAQTTQPGYTPERARQFAMIDRAARESATAAAMTQHAAHIEAQLQRSIYSDDPDAIQRLEARIADLETRRAQLKAYNDSVRAGHPDPSLLNDYDRGALQYISGPFPARTFSKISADIKHCQERLAQLMAPPTPQFLQAKFPGTCSTCSGRIERGAPIAYIRNTRTAHHAECWPHQP